MQVSLAAQFRKDIDEGRLLHPDTYNKVSRACTAALHNATRTQRVALFCAFSLANALEQELEAEVIITEAETAWLEYARHLEAALRVCESETGDGETIRALGDAISAIFPPRGHP